MTDKILLNSNIIIYLQQKKLQLEDIPEQYTQFCASIINYMEVMGFPFESEQEKLDYDNFFKNIELIEITPEIVEKTVELKQLKKRKLFDTIIAATALVNDITLCTRNTDDFENIDKLKLFNPFNK